MPKKKFCTIEFADTSQKLHSFFMEALLQKHHYATEKPKIIETVDHICHERVDLINSNRKAKNKSITSILREGIDRNELFIDDIIKTSITFESATVMFHTPLFFDICPMEELKTACYDVVNLLLTAITSPPRN